MSRFNPRALKEVVVDGQSRYVPDGNSLADVVSPDVQSVSAINPETGQTSLIPRAQFEQQPVPGAFFTNLSDFSKGG